MTEIDKLTSEIHILTRMLAFGIFMFSLFLGAFIAFASSVVERNKKTS